MMYAPSAFLAILAIGAWNAEGFEAARPYCAALLVALTVLLKE